MLKFLYTVFVGVLFAVFAGVGIAAFYPEPKNPEYPIELSRPFPPKEDSTDSAKLTEQQMKYERKSRDFQKNLEGYNRNVSVIALIIAVLLVVIGIVLFRMMAVIPDGLLLGGVGTLLYSIIRGFNANDPMFRFVVVAVSLTIVLIIGYIKFVRQLSKK